MLRISKQLKIFSKQLNFMSSLKDYTIPTSAGVRSIDAKTAFEKLNPKEQAYVYHFSKASWAGAKICYFQRSYESPARTYF